MSDIHKYAATVPASIEAWPDDAAQSWAEARVDDGASPKIVKRAFSGLNAYWQYLKSHKIVARSHNPFDVVVREKRSRLCGARAW